MCAKWMMNMQTILTAQAVMGYLLACVPVDTEIMAPTTVQIK